MDSSASRRQYPVGGVCEQIGKWKRGAAPRAHQSGRATGAMAEPGTRTGGNQRRGGRYQRRVGLSSGIQAESREAWATGTPAGTDQAVRPPVMRSQDRGREGRQRRVRNELLEIDGANEGAVYAFVLGDKRKDKIEWKQQVQCDQFPTGT